MLYKNIETGIVWEIKSDAHITRCEKDSNYEKVEVKKETPKKTNPTKTSPKKATTSTEK
ncbi:hypothetical protein [Paraliobacillus sp. X-1268]|uniref:hypothetical protein n=1 Tax=Paraliobacillus sp. X-1268 TaxID=2213193 RepID=UPI001300BC14|nr:hypothetical protein [Paraliobacillus sp. X-1268]